ncbi:glucose-1-phosphate adenylyltransferase [Pseudomonas sp. MAP12]|uniref:Glucose-1-phosphate adenylyltransferase n=1 Tax=Geopseudomonas aromaticivorans TaxID=2849492 RepID=A0ABS6N372_9GAMM|nr:glucose-1-phosphate adenylyltransferase [Pseudomonas aromaticivorans]MBV2135071.1 glucose-1-phosphate adenylyltransferase [Pseudomonas aromaticivorans]
MLQSSSEAPPAARGVRDGSAVGARFISQLTRDTFAIILAGGRGSRLQQLTEFRSKPAVHFAGKFRIIDFTLSNCVNSGIRRIGVATQYKAHSLIRHIQRGWSFLDGRFNEFVQLLPAQQQTDACQWYQGTADAVYQNLPFIHRCKPEYVLVVAGDHIYKMDYGRMLAAHVRNGADMTVACIEVPIGDAHEFGVMAVDGEDRVVDFVEKPQRPPAIPGDPQRALASMGIYVFRTRFLVEQLERDAATPGSSRDFGKDIIPRILADHRVCAHRFADSSVGSPTRTPYWRDVGTIDAYWQANMDMTRPDPELDLYDMTWPIWTHQKQLPPAKFMSSCGAHGMAMDSLISSGCNISGASVRHSLLFSSVSLLAGAQVEDSVILPEVEVGPGAVLRRCVIDRQCRIPEGMAIGMNPEEDRRRFYVSPRGVTLVTAAMLGQSTAGFL